MTSTVGVITVGGVILHKKSKECIDESVNNIKIAKVLYRIINHSPAGTNTNL